MNNKFVMTQMAGSGFTDRKASFLIFSTGTGNY